MIEVKAGALEACEGNLFKLYGRERHDVGRQTRIQFSAMARRLAECGLSVHLTNCLVLPDYRLEDGNEIISMPLERIIDASAFDQLGRRVVEMLSGGATRSDHEMLRQFLGNEFRVAPDLQVLGEQVRQSTIRLSEGLATWAPRIQSPSGVIRIQATAGSGKTQLALKLLGDATSRGERVLYVCFNRSLADHFGRIASPRAKVTSFHELCVAYHRDHLGEPDFRQEGVFQRLAADYCAAAEEFDPALDLIIIDEGQDFEPDWVQSLLLQLKPQGKLYLLEDDAQRLYARDAFDLEGAVVLTCQDNYRSPVEIVSVINALGLSDSTVEARSPYRGTQPGFRVYQDARTLKRLTAEAVTSLVERGIALADIVVLSGRGHARSVLLGETSIGPYPIRRFAGQYDANGEPQWTEGDLLVESIYRFKGQSAAGVVLTELDFEAIDDAVRRRLFVGLTRAHLAVEMVLSIQAEQALVKLL